jgi:ribonuclease Z
MNDFTLTIIGSGASLPLHGRHPSAQVIQHNNFCCLIDCGEGTQERLKPAGIRLFKINMILISHLHGDHVFGLPGLMSSLTHLGRTEKLSIYGPVGIHGFLQSIIGFTEMRISYPIDIHEMTPSSPVVIFDNDDFEILSFPLYHRIACNGYLVRDKHPKVSMKKDRIHEYRLTTEQIRAVKKGEDVDYGGRIIAASTFLEDAIPPVSYAYCSDTRFDQRLVPSIKDVSVLYHEATFMNDKATLALETGHSTAGDAGRMAFLSKTSCLITGHYSSRYADIEPIILEAEEHFPYVIQAEEGKKYNLRRLAQGINH